MTLEDLQKRRQEIDARIQARLKEMADLKMQVTGAETTIRQWTDEVLIQRGQIMELDLQINELLAPPEVPEEKSKKRGKKNEESET
jgi:hypothetical protein